MPAEPDNEIVFLVNFDAWGIISIWVSYIENPSAVERIKSHARLAVAVLDRAPFQLRSSIDFPLLPSHLLYSQFHGCKRF